MKEYIDKTALMKKVHTGMNIIEVMQAIIDAPAADVVEVRHGRWVNNDDVYGGEDLWWCSACKEEFILIEGTPHDNGYYYCPNCGAQMDGGADK